MRHHSAAKPLNELIAEYRAEQESILSLNDIPPELADRLELLDETIKYAESILNRTVTVIESGETLSDTFDFLGDLPGAN